MNNAARLTLDELTAVITGFDIPESEARKIAKGIAEASKLKALKEEFYEEDGIVYKAVPEEEENQCTGCAFDRDSTCPGNKSIVVCSRGGYLGPHVIWKEVK